MLLSRVLDDQRFQDIVEQAEGRLPWLCPVWTDHNAHDPGITILELMAWYKETLQYRMDRITPEVLREVERVLERKLSSVMGQDFTMAGGIDAVVSLVNSADRTTERNIMEYLEENDPELAEEIKKRLFVFEDIMRLDDRSLQRVMREVDLKELSLALKGATEELKSKFFKNMSKRAAEMLQEDMDFMGPVRVKDVEEAQQKVVNVVRGLEEQGEIIIASGGEDELVV